MKKEKFTIQDFNVKYLSDEACLQKVFDKRFGKVKKCPGCQRSTKFHKITKRKCYACQFCGYQLHPLANTIFHKSSTSLKNWFYAIYLFSTSKNGVSAKELERQLGVTYKCAWRIAKQIRLLFQQSKVKLQGTVEADETYHGGKGRMKDKGKKTPIIGIVERGGAVKATVTATSKARHVIPLIRKNVKVGTTLMTDSYGAYNFVNNKEYDHKRINHQKEMYAVGNIHTNTIEGFWSQLKRSINGTFHAVSPKYLQNYVNEFAYRYNWRNSVVPLFDLILSKAVMPF
ncbi:MAG TPA: IS1595 family transposase [bacterium]|nr:IS1595 family transposase [bacterium]